MNGVQLPQGYKATTRRHFTFYFTLYHKLPSILSFPKKLVPTIFQFARIDCNFSNIYLSRLCIEHKWFEERMGHKLEKILIFAPGMKLKLGPVITPDKRRQ